MVLILESSTAMRTDPCERTFLKAARIAAFISAGFFIVRRSTTKVVVGSSAGTISPNSVVDLTLVGTIFTFVTFTSSSTST